MIFLIIRGGAYYYAAAPAARALALFGLGPPPASRLPMARVLDHGAPIEPANPPRGRFKGPATGGSASAQAHRCSCLNIGGTFGYLCCILAGLIRYIVN
jgi:hypothetical protein